MRGVFFKSVISSFGEHYLGHEGTGPRFAG